MDNINDNIYSVDNGNNGVGGDNDSVLTNGSATTPPRVTSQCPSFSTDYDVALAVLFAILFVFGLLYCFLGYRLFKATMFLTGLLFGSVLLYLICLEEDLLPREGKIGVSVLVGVLCGLITMLVQYVGLFLTGFCGGALIGVAALLTMDYFYTPTTLWVPLGVIFLTGLVFALSILYFQKGLTIFGTSLVGATLMTVSVDFYLLLLNVVHHVGDVITLRGEHLQCWYSWGVLFLCPALFLVGSLVQWRITGKYVDHREAVHVKRGKRRVDLQKLRQREASSQLRQAGPSQDTSMLHPHSRYRHLYQVRRSNGDVISQNYLRGIQNKLSTAVRKKVIASPLPQVSRDQNDPDLDQSQTALTQTQLPDNADN